MKRPISLMRIFILFLPAFLFSADMFSQELSHLMMKSRALASNGKYREAVTTLNEYCSKSPDYRLFNLAGDILLDAGLPGEALNSYRSANLIEQGSGDFGLAKAYALSGDAAAAATFLQSSMRTKFKRGEKEILLDETFKRIENTPEWRALWKKDWYSGLEEGTAIVEFYVSRKKISEATAQLEELAALYPSTEGLSYARTIVEEAKGNTDAALKELDKLIQDSPGNQKYLAAYARLQAAAGNFAGAVSAVDAIIMNGTDDADYLLKRAEYRVKMLDYASAGNDVEKYLEMYKGKAEAIALAGKIASANGDNLKAIAIYTGNIEANPGKPEAWVLRGDSYFSGRSWDLAARDYGMALDLNPSDSEAWLKKGISEINTGKADEGCNALRQSLSLGNRKASALISRHCIK